MDQYRPPRLVAILFLSAALAAGHAGATWRIDTAAAPRNFGIAGHRSSARDGSGTLHVVYGVDHLYHAWLDGGTWRTEVVDEARGVGSRACLAVGPGDVLHVAYRDGHREVLKYALWSGGSWSIQEPAASVGVDYVSLDLDSSGHPCIAYWNGTSDQLRLIREMPGGGWDDELVLQGGRVYSLALVMDGMAAHIAYGDAIVGNFALRYRFWDGASWQGKLLSQGGLRLSMSRDSQGYTHVAFLGDPTMDLRYLRFHPSSPPPAPDIVDPAIGAGAMVSLVLDGAERPRIAYARGGATSTDLVLAHHDGTQWNRETILGGDLVGLNCSLSLDPAGLPHILQVGEHTGWVGLLHTWWDGAFWQHDSVQQAGVVGACTGLVMDPTGLPRILYDDTQAAHVRWAWGTGGAYESEPVPLDVEEAQGADLAMGADGRPRVAAFAYDPNRLVLLRPQGSGWTTDLVAADANLWEGASLALDPADRPHLAYVETSTGALRYARHDGSAWSLETVDSTVDCQGLDLRVNGQGVPCIAYYDAQATALRYADKVGGTWRKGTVDPGPYVGRFCSLALDSADRPAISYQETQGLTLRLARHDGDDWTLATIDPASSVGHETTIALDDQDRPHIGYFDSAHQTIKHAWHDGLYWQIETAIILEAPPLPIHIALDATGRPVLGFQDPLANEIKVAWRLPETWCFLTLVDSLLEPGEHFLLRSYTGTGGGATVPVTEYIVLEALGSYWFWPGWTQTLDGRTGTIYPGLRPLETILDFRWPTGAGDAEGLRFWTALLRQGSGELLDLHMLEWAYWEPV